MPTTEPPFRIADQEYDPAVPVDSVTPHPDNPNEGDVGAIVESVDEHGFFGAVLVQKSTRRIIYGEHRWRAAVSRGAEAIPMFLLDVDDDEALRILLVDNETARKGRNRPEQLAELLATLERSTRGLAGTGYDTDDLSSLVEDLAKLGVDPPERKRVEFEAWDGTKPQTPTSEWGDVWQIGPHRLMCGDSFDEEQVGELLDGQAVKLVVTDPPYAIYGSASGIASDIADDAMVQPFFRAMWRAIAGVLDEFGHAYVCCDWRSYPSVHATAKGSRMEPKNVLVWDKGGAGLGSNYANTHEFIAFYALMPKQTAMGDRPAGQRSVYASNLLRYNRPTGDDRQHNAAKPPDMFREFVRNSSDLGDRVLDLFSGSGTTLIAAAAEGRVGLGMEKDPGMADVIVKRLAKATGLTPEKVRKNAG